MSALRLSKIMRPGSGSPRTGRRLLDCCRGFLPTLLSERVTGWLFAKEVS